MFAGEYFLDLQGDEIPRHPDLLTDLIEPFLESGASMGTLKRVMDSTEDLLNPAVVKVVTEFHWKSIDKECATTEVASFLRGCDAHNTFTLDVWERHQDNLRHLEKTADDLPRFVDAVAALARHRRHRLEDGDGRSVSL